MKTVLLFLLPIIAMLLLTIITPFAILAILAKGVLSSNQDRPYKYVSLSMRRIAVSLDHTGNVIGADLFNAILRKELGYQFGKYGETISRVLAKNKKNHTLTDAGRALANFLDWLDPGHIENSMID